LCPSISLLQVSADAVADEQQGLAYPARVALDSDAILVDDVWVPLVPGMSATAEVETGKRRVIEFFLSPFLRYRDEALRDR
jgi:multidrug efflux pump subunit AcrA (membrane-fusion protein)